MVKFFRLISCVILSLLAIPADVYATDIVPADVEFNESLSSAEHYARALKIHKRYEEKDITAGEDDFIRINTAATHLSRIKPSDPEHNKSKELSKKIEETRVKMIKMWQAELPQKTKPSTPTSSSAWQYSEDFDEMRKKPTKHACVTSDTTLNFSFPYQGEQTAQLCLRVSPAFGKDVLLRIEKGQFLCRTDGCRVNVSFAEGKPIRYSASGPSDYSTTTMFISGYHGFIQKLKKADTIIIEAEFYKEGTQQIKFNTKGLDWK